MNTTKSCLVVFKPRSLYLLTRSQRLKQLKQRYIRFCQFAPGAGRRVAMQLAFWNGCSDLLLRPRGVKHRLLIRAGTSDVDVFMQIFAAQEYACLADLDNVNTIVDAGANVGYSSAYFLSRFPESRVIAVEPDAENFKALQRNLAPYGERVQLYQRGLWSRSAGLVIESETYRDGREWTRQVRVCDAGESPDIEAVTVAELMRRLGAERLSLLKMDIEGAEAVVFADPSCQEWLPMVDAIAIELHEDSGFGPAADLFHAAIAAQDFQIASSGELTICRRCGPALK